ncbi:MAG: hypothetical protein C4533_08290 [Candidatus Omnitrophota bacterium]|jgi:Tol biopolymer transport system component|nr:MAG: hypothetical protein C4533_08290 [Candidatus Omnitrophota bacterium]
MKLAKYILLIVASLALCGCAEILNELSSNTAFGNQQQETMILENNIADDAGVAVVSSDWARPVRASSVNTSGWEDGPYISSDGQELYFAYINIDLTKLPKMVVIGPNRDEANECSPACGQFPRADLFYSQKDPSGDWGKARPHPLSKSYPIGGIVFSNEDRAYFMIEKDSALKTEIYFADRVGGVWRAPQKIDVLSSPYKEDDPYVNPEDTELFFWSDRPAQFGRNNIFYSKKVDGQWTQPAILPKPINSDANDMQPFLFGDKLYFSSDREGKMKIYRSTLKDGIWLTPEVVVEGATAVGEPTLTADGKWLYFVQLFDLGNGKLNPEIMCARRATQ